MPRTARSSGHAAAPLLTLDQLATELNVPRSWLYEHGRTLPHYRVGRLYRFNLSEVLDSLRARDAR